MMSKTVPVPGNSAAWCRHRSYISGGDEGLLRRRDKWPREGGSGWGDQEVQVALQWQLAMSLVENQMDITRSIILNLLVRSLTLNTHLLRAYCVLGPGP